jgi:hypothetical protein
LNPFPEKERKRRAEGNEGKERGEIYCTTEKPLA